MKNIDIPVATRPFNSPGLPYENDAIITVKI